MGMQTGRIKNHFVTSSSRWDNYHGPYLARLHRKRRGSYRGAWSAGYNNRYQWLQVDFGRAAKIMRIATQGRQDTDQWVTQYFILHSLDGIHYMEYKERNSRKVWTSRRTCVGSTPRKYVFDVTSIVQCSSPWTCSSTKVEMKFPLKLHFPSVQPMLRQMHLTNVS